MANSYKKIFRNSVENRIEGWKSRRHFKSSFMRNNDFLQGSSAKTKSEIPLVWEVFLQKATTWKVEESTAIWHHNTLWQSHNYKPKNVLLPFGKKRSKPLFLWQFNYCWNKCNVSIYCCFPRRQGTAKCSQLGMVEKIPAMFLKLQENEYHIQNSSLFCSSLYQHHSQREK